MKSIITEDVMNQVWEIGHQRVVELTKLRENYPTLARQIDGLKRQYIICLNAISTRDFTKIEKTRVIINGLENEFEQLQKEYDADKRRYARAKKIKEDASIEVIDTESEDNKDGE